MVEKKQKELLIIIPAYNEEKNIERVLEELGEARLTDMILNLREPYKTPCRLMLLEQHTAAEAAALCGRPQKTVEAQVYRAKKMLAETIRQERRSEDGMVSG